MYTNEQCFCLHFTSFRVKWQQKKEKETENVFSELIALRTHADVYCFVYLFAIQSSFRKWSYHLNES